MTAAWIDTAYLAGAVLFILGLKLLGSPRTASRGNGLGALGMAIAVGATLLDRHIVRFDLLIGGLALGAVVGVALARMVKMTSMPQLVAVFNGFGGGASALVAAAESVRGASGTALGLSCLVGSITFAGSFVAFGKLQGTLSARGLPVAFNALVLLSCFGLVFQPDLFWWLFGLALLAGVLLVLPVGSADMPVVIALLNAMSGLAAAATGFTLGNKGLIISGSLVGASGVVLSALMCKAMNRSLVKIMLGMGPGSAGGGAADYQVRSASPEEAAVLLSSAGRVIVVPGYGLAVAQAQHALRSLARRLEEEGVEVLFGVHPVAGRMPGHMNVLLAEAEVPYDQLLDLGQVNPLFPQTDVVLVVGANDVCNPAARSDRNSPLYGMPILDVDRARTVLVVKRSLSPGFAGVANPLFGNERTLMVFGDAKKVLLETVAALG